MEKDEIKSALREVLQAEETRRLLAETMAHTIDQEERKRVIKEALREWLDEKYAAFGKWSLAGISASALVVMLIILMWERGWRPAH